MTEEDLRFQDHVNYVKDLYNLVLNSIPEELKQRVVYSFIMHKELYQKAVEALNLESETQKMQDFHVKASTGLRKVDKENELFAIIIRELAEKSGLPFLNFLEQEKSKYPEFEKTRE